MRCFSIGIITAIILFGYNLSFGQSFSPIAISGFNHDVIAETGSSSLATTTSPLDGVGVSDKVMYTVSFGNGNGAPGGGIPDNGIITDAAGSYQLAGYNSSNALIIQRGQNADLNLATPDSFSVLRLLCFSTEGPSLLAIKLTFTDGSVTNALSNYSLGDWFFNTANLVFSGFGRCTRATVATGFDAYPSNPRMYYIEIPLSCGDRQKSLQKLNISNITTAGTNAPYPNAVFLALSGKQYKLAVNSSITNALCNAGGSATLDVTGSSAPYSVSWNSNPVQTGLTASNLQPGNYVASITDAASCNSSFSISVTLDTNLILQTIADTTLCKGVSYIPTVVSNGASFSWTPASGVSNTGIINPQLSPVNNTEYTVTASLGSCSKSRSFEVFVTDVSLSDLSDTTICTGSSFVPNLVGNATSYSWLPVTGVSNPTILQPQLSPFNTTTYTVTGILAGCSTSRSFVVTVTNLSISNRADTSICYGASFNPRLQSNADSYSWSPATGLNDPNVLNPLMAPTVSTFYTLTGTTGLCTISRSFRISVYPQVRVNAGNDISIFGGQSVTLQGSGSVGTYLWTPSTGLSAVNVLQPLATPALTTTYTLTITASNGCANSSSVTVNVVPYCVKPLNAFSPNGDGINDTWLVTTGGCTDNIRVMVYNRYGSKVFESQDYRNDWKGTYQGKPLPDGTYYYVLTYFLLSGKTEFRKGDVTIIR